MSPVAGQRLQFHVLSFEGPDPYARAGGLAARVDGLTRALAELGFETHLWFVGDPGRPGHEVSEGVHLHRWCQWLSEAHPRGVYDGEDGKLEDFSRSLPPYLLRESLMPHLKSGGNAVVMAEEWHTVEAVIELDRQLRAQRARSDVVVLWNANNLFGFERIDWGALGRAAVVTTVSRMMRFRMEPMGIRPLVLPNGIPPEALRSPERSRVSAFRRGLARRVLLAKVARWDPDKGWLEAVASTARLRDEGTRPLLIARGGVEGYEAEVRKQAERLGLRWEDRVIRESGPSGIQGALVDLNEVDLVCLRSPLDPSASRLLLRASDAVLANSRFEPFGLVGLETMAVGGVACTGLTGEDYVVAGRNALVLQTDDPGELSGLLQRLREHPEEETRLRRAARATATQYTWTTIATRVILPRLALLRGRTQEGAARAASRGG